ncbi:MAG: hypothetical protein JNJ56_14755, partial [Ignavibacteria bacterium]|nr:hypothetical protein [Ignavibacteria bacterium]
VYKMNMVYTDAPVVPNVDAQALTVGSTGSQVYSSLDIIPFGIVKNNNPAEPATFTVTRKITPGSYVSTKTVTNLGALSSVTVYFDQWTFTSGVNYTVRDSVYIAGDLNNSNDVLTGSLTPFLGEIVYKVNEDFSGSYPPLNWSFQYTGTNYWVYGTVSGYGTGTGSDKYDFWNSPNGTNQSMFTPTFTAAVAGDSLQYDYAYAPYTTGTDSLIIETSTNGGTSYTVLVKLQGRASDVIGATNSLKTAATTSAIFEPTNSQWLTRKWALPAGTNKIKFRARSASGNNLYLDNIKINSPASLYTQYNITLVPQGMYNGSGKNMSDTVRVYLRNSTFPYASVDSSVSVINDVTLVTPCIFKNASTGNYYMQIKHRNSLEVWSKTGGESITKGVTGNYDFTSGASQTFGDNAILVGKKYCIPSGDINQDGIIDASDLSSVENDVAGSVKGYVVTDVTGDNYVDAADLSIVENNASISYGVITP